MADCASKLGEIICQQLIVNIVAAYDLNDKFLDWIAIDISIVLSYLIHIS